MNTTWDAEKYGSDFSYVPEYGRELIGLIDAGKGASVLDLGCGNGTLTKELKDSGYNVQGIDQSDELLSVASENCPGIRFHKGDASFFSLEEPVDVVFPTLCFTGFRNTSIPFCWPVSTGRSGTEASSFLKWAAPVTTPAYTRPSERRSPRTACHT